MSRWQKELDTFAEIAKAVAVLPSEFQVVAFQLLADRALSGNAGPLLEEEEITRDSTDSMTSFFSKHDGKKPSENALLIATFFYGEYGTDSFTVDDVRELASNVGVTIPDRIDMTYLSAKRGGKALFRRAGRGSFRPTVNGETLMTSEYGVRKGKKKRAPKPERDT